MVALIAGVVVLSLGLINRLPVEVVEGPAINATPPSTSQPGLLAIVLTLHPRLAAAYETGIEAIERVKLQFQPEPVPRAETFVVYEFDNATGNFVPGRR